MSPRLPRILAAAIATLGIAACSTSSPEASPPPASTTATATAAASGPAPATGPAGTATTGTPAASAPLKDGRWPGYLKSVDGDTSLTMDLVEFLTGDPAAKAWKKKYPDSDEDTPPNDYFIVNDNTKVRKLPMAPAVVVKVVGGTGAEADKKISPAGLKDYLGSTLFWFTVKNGKVTVIEEQFLP